MNIDTSGSKDRKQLIALSGGADSVALLLLLIENGYDCIAAHCNFHLRGDESNRDEKFVRELCSDNNIKLIVKDFDVESYKKEHKCSTEMACRELRYEWFENERKNNDCEYIAVAHHSDDQVETIFLNLLRGTGVKGLTGMSIINGNIWRPLLNVSKNKILGYLKGKKQDYVTDSTNLECEYKRNKLRNSVLPTIYYNFSGSKDRILYTAKNLKKDFDLISELIDNIFPNKECIDIERLTEFENAENLLYHCAKNFGFSYDQCINAVNVIREGKRNRRFISYPYYMYINNYDIVIKNVDESSEDVLYEYAAEFCEGPFNKDCVDGKNTIALNNNSLDHDPWVVRKWKDGDKMIPFGRRKPKLVSDILNDYKIPSSEKKDICVLEIGGEIVWIIGVRASNIYTVGENDKEYIKLNIKLKYV